MTMFLPPKRHGFSLVELLIVIAVMALLVGLTVVGPATQKSGALREGGGVLGGVADQARDLAQSGRRPTALAVAIKGSDAYRRFVILQRDTSGNWLSANRWMRLPEGIIMDWTDVDANFFTSSASSISNAISIAGATMVPGEDFIAQEFGRDGTLIGQTLPLRLRLREGFLPPNGQPTFTAGTTNRYFDVVLIPTGGRVKYVQP